MHSGWRKWFFGGLLAAVLAAFGLGLSAGAARGAAAYVSGDTTGIELPQESGQDKVLWADGFS